MYRKLKNILGVSLMVLAIVISQIPMPEAQAEIANTAVLNTEVDDISAHTVTFSMNGGSFDGTYNGYRFKEQTPVLVIDDGDVISSFPDEKYASFSGCRTEQNKWYTDIECLNEYNKDKHVTESITLYKKWYRITSDGTTLADKGFHLNPDGSILYKYDGEQMHVEIPETVKVIVKDAFSNLDSVRGITLPSSIKEIDDNAFSGLKDGEIIYIYDSNTSASKDFGKQLDNQYEQLVYSEYLDLETVEEIAGISFNDEASKENTDAIEKPETKEGSDAGDKPNDSSDLENKPEDNNGSGNVSGDKPTESETEPEGTNTGTETESSGTKESETETESAKPEESSTTESETESESKTESESTDTTESETESESSKPEESSTTDESTDTEESESEESSSSGPIVVEEFTVTFDIGITDIDIEVKNKEVFSGDRITEPESPQKDTRKIIKDDKKQQEITYTFKGWFKDKNFSKAWDFSKDTVESDTTLYAKWDKKIRAYYYVTFVAEGATNVPKKQKLYEDQKLQKPSQEPSAQNKIFKGWYTDKTNTSTEFKAWGKPITKNMTLYAQFEEKSYTVVFHMNGGGFTGKYNDSSYTDAASLTAKVTVGKGIESAVYPGGSSTSGFKYSNYTTDTEWYKDKECLEPYTKKDSKGADTVLSGDLTLYKKWYYTSSGFTMNTTSKVLYKYGGNVEEVTIPNTVNIIGENAFSSVGSISTITLPDNISDVRPNAFSGVNNISKDITITGKTENAKNTAKKLANEYQHLVYKDSPDDKSSVVTTAESGSIKLGATIAGSVGSKTNNQTSAANKNTNTTPTTGSISLGASTVNTTGTSVVQPNTSTAPSTSGEQKTTGTQNTVSAAGGSQSGTAASSAKTTKKQNVTSASAPRSTEHIKDSTPKTGDPLQYRMLLVCAMFSVGSLLVLTGNGRKKKSSAS